MATSGLPTISELSGRPRPGAAQVESLVYLLRSSPAEVLTDLLVGMARLDGVGSDTLRRAAERHLDDEVTEEALDRLGPPDSSR